MKVGGLATLPVHVESLYHSVLERYAMVASLM